MNQAKLAVVLTLLAATAFFLGPYIFNYRRYSRCNAFSTQESKDNNTWKCTFVVDKVKTDPAAKLVPIQEVWIECVVEEKSVFGLPLYVAPTNRQQIIITYPRGRDGRDIYSFSFDSVGAGDDPNCGIDFQQGFTLSSVVDDKRSAFTFMNSNTPKELVLTVTRYDENYDHVPVGKLYLRKQ